MATHRGLMRRFHFRLIFICLVVFSSITIILLLFHSGSFIDPRRCFSLLDNGDQISAYKYKLLDDVLLADEKPIPGRSIFFHDTSCNERPTYSLGHLKDYLFESTDNGEQSVNGVNLTARQACAIESAALHNPNFDIYVLFTKQTYMDNSSNVPPLVEALLTYPNVKLRNLNLWTYAAGTPMYEWLKEGILFESTYVLSHTSDFLRYLTLWRWGGLYLDLDTVSLRSMEEVPPNYTGAESNHSLAAGVMNFSPTGFGHEVATLCLHDFKKNFDGDRWGNNGPGVITRVLNEICDTTHISLMTKESNRCRGFKVFDRDAFYAVPYKQWRRFMQPEYLNSTQLLLRKSYVMHVWNNFSKHQMLKTDSKTVYTKLASIHCPKVYKSAGMYF